jgi:hypothetical protein
MIPCTNPPVLPGVIETSSDHNGTRPSPRISVTSGNNGSGSFTMPHLQLAFWRLVLLSATILRPDRTVDVLVGTSSKHVSGRALSSDQSL